MSRTIERTLTMLLPTATGGIPRELIDTTSSLIAQSRHKLSNLKQAEEPAREMLCAHLACERLRTKLDLPVLPDKPPAPVPPRLYKTLYKQFSETLVIGSSARAAAAAGSSITLEPHGPTATTTSSTTTPGRSRTRNTAVSKPKSAFITNTPALKPSSTTSRDKNIEPYIPLINELCNSDSDRKTQPPTATETLIRHMQDRLDFLSDKRRKAYGEWKTETLRRIAQLEA
ncbi:hypothetical protein TWF173_008823 [Orbilia oligospora]|nr:hypothetical protein TWF173_008823 [Orbilia oligospora]